MGKPFRRGRQAGFLLLLSGVFLPVTLCANWSLRTITNMRTQPGPKNRGSPSQGLYFSAAPGQKDCKVPRMCPGTDGYCAWPQANSLRLEPASIAPISPSPSQCALSTSLPASLHSPVPSFVAVLYPGFIAVFAPFWGGT